VDRSRAALRTGRRRRQQPEAAARAPGRRGLFRCRPFSLHPA